MKLTIQPAPVAISGGLGDIGRAMARFFADSACPVAVGDLAEKSHGLPEGTFYHRLDVTDPVSVDAGLSGRMFSANPPLKEQARNRVTIHQLISADEVAAQVLFLCSNASSQTTGTTLLQDGGLSLTQEPMA